MNMQIKLIVVGKLKEKHWKDAIAEYRKRLGPYLRLEIIEVSEERIQENPSAFEIAQVLEKEGERILRNIPPSFYAIPLVIEGKMCSSIQLANMLEKLAIEGKSQVAFIIGGSHGLSRNVLGRGDYLLSFSPLTFPHQLVRVILVEQIYRAFSIINGSKYHK